MGNIFILKEFRKNIKIHNMRNICKMKLFVEVYNKFTLPYYLWA